MKKPLSFWNSDAKMRRIKLINPGDIKIEHAIKKVGVNVDLGDLGICNPKEVLERNKALQFLNNNPKFRKQVRTMAADERKLSLPNDENNFLFFYSDEKNPYWETVKDFIAKTEGVQNKPLALDFFLRSLKEDLKLEEAEKAMAQDISGLLSNIAFIEGAVTVRARFDYREQKIICSNVQHDRTELHGYKVYKSNFSARFSARIADYWNNPLFDFLGIKSLAQSWADQKLNRRAREASLINVMSCGLEEDLERGAQHLIDKFYEYKNDSNHYIPDAFNFVFYFSYNQEGLRVRLMSIETIEKAYGDFTWKHDNLPVMSDKHLKILERKAQILNEKLSVLKSYSEIVRVYSFFDEKLFKEVTIPSPMTDADYKWFAIGHLYNSKKWKKTYTELIGQRKFFFDTLKNFNKLSEILQFFEMVSKRNDWPLCIPEILPDRKGVFFNNLAPISSVADNVDKVIPITLERINGQMVGLTGRHGRGKTTIGQSTIHNVYFALSGLPVFAESFSTDIKTVLGAVTNDEGNGSTATNFVQKVTNLMKGITKVLPHESLIFIDEIGKGTQQEAGLELGKAILTALSKRESSVLFNTQILELAEYASEKLNAVCYKVDSDYKFAKGIAGGDIEALIKEVGLDKYLK